MRFGGFMNRVFASALIAATLTPGYGGAAASAPMDDAKAAYMRHDYTKAAQLIRPLAERGNADAQAKLGDLYRRGFGVQQSLAEAARWYRLAAVQGNARGQNNLGLMYYYMGKPGGDGEDYVRAYMWYDIAVAAKNPEAVINLKAAAALLKPAQIARAREMARKCRASQFKSCG
jgi:TPR repeat protein